MVRELPIEEDQVGRQEVTSDRVYMRHLRAAKICSPGARSWWKRREWSWTDFLTNGIAAQTLLETGDPDAARVVKIARDEDVK